VLVSQFPIDVRAIENEVHNNELFLQTIDPDPVVLGPIKDKESKMLFALSNDEVAPRSLNSTGPCIH
jgi:hypothetical protein